jgi:transposase-like protein
MKRYSEADKAWLVEEWAKSGKSQWAFAKELGLNYQSFSKWTSAVEPAEDFVEVGNKLEERAKEPEGRTLCGLVVEQGSLRVHLPAGVTASDLAIVVQGLR